MKIFRLNDSRRERLSATYLRVAYNLPTILFKLPKIGVRLKRLHSTAKYFLSGENRFVPYETKRPPEVTLNLKVIRVIDFVHIEDINQLAKRLRKKFRVGLIKRDIVQPLDDYAADYTMQGFASLGYIVRDLSKSFLLMGRGSEYPRLPEEVEYIHAFIVKSSPSIFAVIFDATLRDSVSDKLKQLDTADYPTQVVFHNFFRPSGHGLITTEHLRHRAVDSYSNTVVSKITNVTKNYVKGELSKSRDGETFIPHIRIFTVSNNEGDKITAESLMKETYRYFENYNISPHSGVYVDTNSFFSMSREKRKQKSRLIQGNLVIFEDRIPCDSGQDRDDAYGSFMEEILNDRLYAFNYPITLISMLENMARHISKHYIASIKLSRKRAVLFSNFLKLFKLNRMLLEYSMLVDRINVENKLFESRPANLFEKRLDNYEFYTMTQRRRKDKAYTLKSYFNSRVGLLNKSVHQQLQISLDWLTRYSQLRSFYTTYWLQWAIFIITVVTLYLTL